MHERLDGAGEHRRQPLVEGVEAVRVESSGQGDTLAALLGGVDADVEVHELLPVSQYARSTTRRML